VTAPIVLGVDPGLARMGLALVRLEPEREEVLGLAVIRTDKEDGELASVGNVRRAQEISDELLRIAKAYDVRLIAAEAMSFPRSASNSGKMSMSWGALAFFARAYHLPIEQAQPQAIKAALCKNKKASKEDVEMALLVRYGNHIEELYHGVHGQRDHAYDALGSVVTVLERPAVKRLRALARVA
jgi:Holliday junction resolvasome RuvABC endonuclease subunit